MTERSDQHLERGDGAGPLPLTVRKALWDRLWLRLLAPPVDALPPPQVHGPADVNAGDRGDSSGSSVHPLLDRVTRREDVRG